MAVGTKKGGTMVVGCRPQFIARELSHAMRRIIAPSLALIVCIDGMPAFAKEKPRTKGASAGHPFRHERAGTLEVTQSGTHRSVYPIELA